jgi:hypothetical protein
LIDLGFPDSFPLENRQNARDFGEASKPGRWAIIIMGGQWAESNNLFSFDIADLVEGLKV